MDYIIIVNDSGELKTITATEMESVNIINDDGTELISQIDMQINVLLDRRSKEKERATDHS